MKTYITIAVFTYPHEYIMLKPLFEKANIKYFFQNERMIELIPLCSYAMGGIHLKVERDELIKAKLILDSFIGKTLYTHLKIV